MDLALAQEDTSCHPVDVGVLEEGSGLGPIVRPTEEPDELLATIIELVDDGSDRVRGVATAWSKLCNLLGDGCVGDGGRVMVDTLCRKGSASIRHVNFMLKIL